MTKKQDPFTLPSEVKGATVKKPGDFERSEAQGRPYVYDETGKRRLYSRITTFIDCLSDRTTLEKWKQRIILTGLVDDMTMSPSQSSLWWRLLHTDLDDRKELTAIAEAAFDAGDGHLKASQGTDMHYLTECWDRGEPLPEHDDREAADFAAWLKLIEDHDLVVEDIERRCVVDNLKVAGTPDRTYWYQGELVLGDLKTGAAVGHDPGKMAMQLAIASRGQWYDTETHQRTDMGVSTEVGLILHVPNGGATAALYRADLTEGWRGVQLAQQVRQWRNTSKKLLVEA